MVEYYVTLDDNNRIVMASLVKQNDEQILVEFENIQQVVQCLDYRYEDGQLIYDPLPPEPEPDPQPNEVDLLKQRLEEQDNMILALTETLAEMEGGES